MTVNIDAIILAGGSSRRLGGVDKAVLRLDGIRLLDRAIVAVQPANRIVVVGQPREIASAAQVHWTLEDPPHGGPLAGIEAGLACLDETDDGYVAIADDGYVAILACDVPHAAGAVRRLREQLPLPSGYDAIVATDAAGVDQHLLGIYRGSALADAIGSLATTRDLSVRRALGGIVRVRVEVPDLESADVDTREHCELLGVGPARAEELDEKRGTDS